LVEEEQASNYIEKERIVDFKENKTIYDEIDELSK